MRVSVDASFVYAMIKNELSPSERARAQSVLLEAESVHVAMVVLEELFRFSPAGTLPSSESRLARYAAIQQFLLTVEVRPITKQLAYEIAELWRVAHERGATSTTVDAFAAREAVHAQCTMLTCDDHMRRYMTRGFGEASVRYFPQMLEVTDPSR